MTSSPSSFVVGNLFRSSAVYFLSSVLTNGAMFLNSIAVSWYLDKEGLGIFSLCLTAVMMGGLIADLGLNTIILRNHADRRKSPSMRLVLKVRALTALALTLCMIGVGVLFLRESAFLIFTAALLILPRSISGAAESYLKADTQRRTFFLVTALSSILQILLVWGVAAGGALLPDIFLALAAIESGKAALLLLLLRPVLAKSGTAAASEYRSLGPLLAQGFPFAIIAFLSLLTERADLFFLATLRGAGETGIYAGAERFLMLGNLFAFSFYGSALPIFSSLRGNREYGGVVRKTTVIACGLSLACAAVLAVGAEWIIAASFRFADSVLVLRILAASLPGIVVNAVLRIALFSLDHERPVATVFVGALALNTLFNILFIPRFGAVAAAWIAVGTEYAVTFSYVRLYLAAERGARAGTAG